MNSLSTKGSTTGPKKITIITLKFLISPQDTVFVDKFSTKQIWAKLA